MANRATTVFSGVGRRSFAARQITARRCLIVVAISACFASAPAWSNPTAPQVVNGSASFNQAGKLLTVNNTNGAIINWNTFAIGAGETTRFNQVSTASSVLNRVITNDPSVLLGTLSSNGRVWLVNPAGIMVGQGARIDVAGFIASTLNVRNEDFLAGRLNFGATPNAGRIENRGQIATPSGGSVYLIAPAVENHGIINAPGGEVILAAGQTAQLIDTGTPGVKVDITGAEGNATNLGEIVAEAGRIGMAGVLVKNSGTLNASSLVREGGRIFLKATKAIELADTSVISADGTKGGRIIAKTEVNGQIGGELIVRGELSAQGSGAMGNGGFIETSAAHLKIANDAKVSTAASMGLGGTWLIDPFDFTIAATGGDITGAALGTALGAGGVTIQTASSSVSCVGATCGTGTVAGNGDIFVNDAVSWAANKLTLSAYRNININANLNGSGSASLALQYGQGAVAVGNLSDTIVHAAVNLPAGPNFSTKLGSDGVVKNYTVITALGAEGSFTTTDLQGMSGNLAGYYALGSNIDAAATSTWNANAGFAPVGNATNFTGAFDGLGHTITGLTINRGGTDDIGLFGITNGATIRNIGLVGGAVLGKRRTGGLVGQNRGGSITNSYNTGSVTAACCNTIGGLVGFNYYGTITNSYNTGSVYGSDNYAGGLVGANQGGTITNSYNVGSVYGSYSVGGLVGENMNDHPNIITNSYNTGSVSGNYYVGGLVGANGRSGTVTNSYSTGSVTGGNVVGGLVGQNGSTITNSYSTGSVSGNNNVGGLVGYNNDYNGNYPHIIITNSYSTGSVTGNSSVGGLVGYNGDTVTNSYWDTETSGKAGSAGGIGMITADMMTQANFTSATAANGNVNPAWDFTNTWWMSEGNTRPFLRSEYSTTITNAHQLQLMGMNATTLAASYTLGANINMAELSQASGLWNTTKGFVPVGDATTKFTGAFDGFGHTITALTINRPATDYVGLFGYTNGATIKNIGLVGGSVSGNQRVGGLVGWNIGAISNSYNTGTVSGGYYVGGLVGTINSGTISNSYSTGSVSGPGQVGGLAGNNNSSGTISNSYSTGNVFGSTGNVSGYEFVGGLAGYNTGIVTNSYATGAVTGNNDVGGLVGKHAGGTAITSSYSTGTVSGYIGVGGLVGHNSYSMITDSYSTGSVSGVEVVGGLVGYNPGGTISNSYSTGIVSGNNEVGGLVGRNTSGTITNSFWDTTTSGNGTSADGTGLTTVQMMQSGNLTGFDFTNVWNIVPGISYPYLKLQFSGTPQVLSGSATGLAAGKTIQVIANGANLAQANTGANGFYYLALPGNSVPSGNTLVAYVAGDAFKGASAYGSSGTHATGLAISQNTLTISGGNVSNSGLGTAKGLLTSADIPYGVSGSNLSVSSGFAFQTLAGTNYTLDGDVTTVGNQSYSGTLTLPGSATLRAQGSGSDLVLAGTITGTGAANSNLFLRADRSITFNTAANVTSTNALNVLVNADSDGPNGGAIVMNTGSSITSKGGNITLGGGTAGDGTGNAIGNATYINGIYLTGATLDAGGGNIALKGTGFAGTSSANGIYVTDTSTVQTSGAGTITLNGTGGAGANNNNGVRIGTSSSIAAANGAITLTGDGGVSTGNTNMGVYVHNGATITTASGTGGITLDGTGGSSGTAGTSNRGVRIASGASVATNSGAIGVTGQGGYDGDGVQVVGASTIQSTSGAITITGTSGDGVGSDYGVYITASDVGSGNTLITSGGNIAINGTSLGTSGSSNRGIRMRTRSQVIASGAGTLAMSGQGGLNGDGLNISDGARLTTAAGLMSLTGTAGAGVGDAVFLSGTPTGGVVNAAAGLTINGTGDVVVDVGSVINVGASSTASISATNNILFSASSSLAPSTGAFNIALNSDSNGAGGGGIYLGTSSSINSNGGNILMSGGLTPATTRAIGNGTVTGGITFNSGITVLGDITAGAGNVTMRGEGVNSGSNHFADGIMFGGGLLSSNGTVIIDGKAHVRSETTTGTEVTAGVEFLGGGTRLSTQTGTVTVTGLNDAPAGFARAQGITVGAGTVIETTGTGTLTLNGTSTGYDTGWGVGVFGGTVRTTAAAGGALTLNGTNITQPDGGVVIYDGQVLSGGGAINITGESTATSVGFINYAPNALMLGGTNSGDITITGLNTGNVVAVGAYGGVINAGAANLALNGATIDLNNFTLTAGSIRIRAGAVGLTLPASTSITASGDVELGPLGNADMCIGGTCAGALTIGPSILSRVNPSGVLVLGRPVTDTSYTGKLTVLSDIPSSVVNGSKLALNGYDVEIDAAASIGTTGVAFNKPLDILANRNLTVAGNIVLDSTQDLVMNAGQSVNGLLDLNSGSALVFAGNITLNNPRGAITGITVLQTPVSGTLSAHAYGGISLTGGNFVDTFVATNTGSGDIVFYNTGDFNLETVTNSAASGTIFVDGSNSITQTGDLTTSGGAISVTAYNNLTMGSSTKAQSNGGTISYESRRNSVQLGLLDAGAGDVYVVAGENITDGNGPSTNNIKAGYANLLASNDDSGPGSIDVDTQVPSLYVNNDYVYSTTGQPSNPVTVRNSGSPLAVSAYSKIDTGQLTVTNDSTINVGHIGGATNTTLTATGPNADITVAQGVGTLLSDGNIVLNAGRDIVVTHDYVDAGGSVTATAGRDIRIRNTDGATGSGSAYIQAANGIDLTMQTGKLYIDGNAIDPAYVMTTSGNINVVTSAGFANGSNSGYGGTDALSAPLGRWLVYAPNPASVFKNGLIPTLYQYNTAYGGTIDPAGSGFIYASPFHVDANFSGTLSSTFGSSPAATPGYVLRLLDLDGDDATTTAAITGGATYSNWPITSSTAAGSYGLQYVSGLSASSFYTLTPGTSQTYTVNQAILQAVAASLTGTSSKTYDGTTNATLAPGNFLLSGFVSNDSASVTKTTGTYSSKNVGSNIQVSTSLVSADFSPAGSTNLSNYTLPTSATGNIGVITPANLSITGLTAQNKVYDATTVTTLTGGTLTGVIVGDSVSLATPTGSFNNKNVGSAKPVTVTSLILSGTDAGNYSFTSPTSPTGATLTADITPASLSLSGLSANNKVYDATTVATVSGALTGVIAGDAVSLATPTASFNNKNVGSAKPVTVTGLTLTGADAGNYSFTPPSGATLSADITPASLTLSGLKAENKVYDATTAATLSGTAVFAGVLGTDVVTLGGNASARFADKNVGIAKPVSVTGLSLGGADAGNYTLSNTTAATSADITARALNVTAKGVNRVYDGQTGATATYADNRVTGDVLTPSGSAKFIDKNVGTAKTVNVSGITLTGADAGNYKLDATTAATTADITVRPLSTWIGEASGNWSVAANWDALPDLSNVNAIAVPAGKSVTYDAAAGSTNLASLTAAGLIMAGGSLNIANSLTVSSSFSQSGGTLGFGSGASASITQASGNLNLSAVTLASLSLNAPAGAITQSGAIVAAALNTQSQTGTTLGNSGNRVGSFTAANNGSGNVALTNTGALTITGISNGGGNITVDNTGAVTTVGALSAPSGAVSILAHSPLTIGAGGVSAAGNITLSASETPDPNDTLTLSGPISSTGSGGSIALSSGDNLVQNANVSTKGGAVSAVSQTGNISMALGTTTSTGGGSIGYTASSGNVVLTSLDAGSGAIALNAGKSIQPAPGFAGANLTGGSAVIAAGGSANLSTQVRLLDVTVEGKFSVTDVLTGTVITDVPAALPLSTTTAPVLSQVLSTVVATTQQQPTQAATQTPAAAVPPPLLAGASGGSGPLLLANTTQTIGGTANSFGSSSAVDSLPATSAGSSLDAPASSATAAGGAPAGSVASSASGGSGGTSGAASGGGGDKPAAEKPTADRPSGAKPADDKLASAKKDDTKAEDKKEDDKKKKDEETPAKKDEAKPAAKKLATCS